MHSQQLQALRMARLGCGAIAFGLTLLALSCPAVRTRAQPQVEASARALEERLHAPCCRDRPLTGHDSEPSRKLQAEIRARLRSGESPLAVESALVAEYGDSLIAVPRDHDPRPGLSSVLAIIVAAAAALLTLLGVRWVRRTRADAEPVASVAAPRDELDAKLDAELREL